PTGLTADITAKELTVSGAVADDKTYDGSDAATINLTGATLNGVVPLDDVSLTNGGGTFASMNVANDIAVTANLGLDGADAGNYLLTQPTGLSANISAAPVPSGSITLTPPSSLTYDGTAKEYQASSSGPSSFLITYEGRNSTTYDSVIPPTDAGEYTVTATVTDPNYDNSAFESEEFTIAKASQTITFPPVADGVVGGSTTLTASSSSGLTVSYSSSHINVATVSGTTLSFVGLGTATITASQAGDSNYLAATDVTRTVNVTSPDGPWDKWADDYSMANGTERAKNSDPDGDGFVNEMEFAFGTHPKARNAEVFASHAKVGTNYVVTFNKRKLSSEATYDIRSSSDLKQPFTNGTTMTLAICGLRDATM
ncbi:MAG: hypothetical protein EBV83_10635, partial [Verrucomicrobia bacterium]|nr:hypothetical protein [Verrucomicrobiota bacterium]